MPTHESERRRRLSPPAARAAPPALPRPFPQPDPSPQSPSSVTSLCRVRACKIAAPTFVPRRVIGQKRIDQNLGRALLDAKCGMAEPCQFHRNCLLGNLSLCWKCKLSSQLFTCTFHQLGLLTLQRCLRIHAVGSLGSCRAIRIMTGGIPELLCKSPSSGVDLNQDFSRLRFRHGTCYRLKLQLVCKLHCFHLWHCSTP